MEQYYLISDAAKEVNVETHVLRYWEEELALPIKRNDLGHRYYTEEDVECFRQIKTMKERGLQLKAIKVILKDGTLTMLEEGKQEFGLSEDKQSYELVKESSEDKTKRMQYLLQEMLKDAVRANNEALVQDIKEAVIKELDYQFRAREEHEEEMERRWEQRSEEHYKRIDELLRKKTKKKLAFPKKAPK
ncbi:MAG: MerR family transcriptional regulator [Lachnospiraceae bacterium]|nr:MerR family transcriptional regulator [Lachnospiraceae bacterium]